MGSEEGGDPDQTVPVFFLFFALLLAAVLLLTRALHGRPRLGAYLSEPALTLLASAFVSFLVKAYFAGDDAHDEDDAGEGGGEARARDDDDVYDGFYSGYSDDDGTSGHRVNVDGSQLSRFLLTFSGGAFFMVFLPPIMFNSGYELQRELFFRHIKPIVSFAVMGTALAGVVTGLTLFGMTTHGPLRDLSIGVWELLTFGSLITATDTVSVLGVLNAKRVDPHLFSLVFGESALNDAVAIVMFRTFSRLVGSAGASRADLLHEGVRFASEFLLDVVACPLLGTTVAIFSALVFKHVDFDGAPVLELSLYLLIMYVPFLLAEVLGMSGIITIFVTGMSARRYIEPNVSAETRRNAAVIFHLVAYLAETCIFLNLGLSVCGFRGTFHWAFAGCAFAASLLGRAVGVYALSFLHNLSLTHWVEEPCSCTGRPGVAADVDATDADASASFEDGRPGETRMVRRTPERKLDKVIPAKFMHFLWFAGLRGAVAYACAREFPDANGNQSEVVAATTAIVYFSIVVMGACCEPLLRFLGIPTGVDDGEYMRDWRGRRRLDGRFQRFEKRFVYDLVVRKPAEQDAEQKPFHLVPNEDSTRQVVSMERATVRMNSISMIDLSGA